jgi:hypothetical protein
MCWKCPKENPTIEHTFLSSKEWRAWYNEVYRRMKKGLKDVWDVDETQECGWMSEGHWKSFIKFTSKNGN